MNVDDPEFRNLPVWDKWEYTEWKEAWDFLTGEISHEYLGELWVELVQFAEETVPLKIAKLIVEVYKITANWSE